MTDPGPKKDWTPSDAELLAFEHCLLAEARARAVEQWLEATPGAAERLERLAGRSPDKAVEALRAPDRISGEMGELSQLAEQVIRRCQALAGGPTKDEGGRIKDENK